MIRIMTPDDYDAVHACWMACAGMGLNTVDDSREGTTRYLTRNPHTCFVSEQDGTITGAILAGHDGRRSYIYHTAVNPAYRRQGIGTALVNAALHALANEGIINGYGNGQLAPQGLATRAQVAQMLKNFLGK